MANNQRSRLVIEPEIQYALIWQLCRQWILHLAASLMLLAMLQVLLGGFFRSWEEHVQRIWPMLASLTVAMVVLLPMYIRSSFHLSNRFVGPIHRLRKELRAIGDGKGYSKLNFRESDFWPQIAEELDNAMHVAHQSNAAERLNESGIPNAHHGHAGAGGGIILDTGSNAMGNAEAR